MLKRTALFEEHRKLGGRLIDFGGWELPVQYTSVIEEHQACRKAAGLFDVSHMGEIAVEGPAAEDFLDLLVTNNVRKLAPGQAQYTVMCLESGGIVDDLLIYRRGPDRFLLVVNAANATKDLRWILSVAERFRADRAGARFAVEDRSAEYSQIALQGRLAQELLQPLTDLPLGDIKYYWFKEGTVLGDVPALIARTGYTGEDGFEIYLPWDQAPALWKKLLEAGSPRGLLPCGLGARDTLRLEMRYPLYGQELDERTTPLEAGLGWVTKLDKPAFIGRESLLAAREAGVGKSLVGLSAIGRGIPRTGHSILATEGAAPAGRVTSGTQSPSLKKPIALGYVPPALSAVGTRLWVDIRGSLVPAEVVPTPFYKRNY
jgi:aminomethyltransferase